MPFNFFRNPSRPVQYVGQPTAGPVYADYAGVTNGPSIVDDAHGYSSAAVPMQSLQGGPWWARPGVQEEIVVPARANMFYAEPPTANSRFPTVAYESQLTAEDTEAYRRYLNNLPPDVITQDGRPHDKKGMTAWKGRWRAHGNPYVLQEHQQQQAMLVQQQQQQLHVQPQQTAEYVALPATPRGGVVTRQIAASGEFDPYAQFQMRPTNPEFDPYQGRQVNAAAQAGRIAGGGQRRQMIGM